MVGGADYGIGPGDIIDGKYRVESELGSGGMAVVWAAYHLRLDERVALKVLRRDCADNPEALARFRREARAAVKIKGEHVARVMDVGALSDGTPYMVMEHLDGSDLAQLLRNSGPLPVQQAVGFLLQAAEALAEAHVLGIVHRDVKPGNLFVTQRPDGTPCVKVLDFGISKLGGLATSSITQGTALIGTPLYMSPEQLHAARLVDARTDIWALGVILYELLTGEPPFKAETMPEVVHHIVNSVPVAPSTLRPDLPLGLEAVVLRCLEKDREARFPNVAAFARALSAYAAEHARTSGERVAQIIESGPRASLQVTAPQGARPALRFWPHATTITGKRALRMGMAASAGLAMVALTWVHYLSTTQPPAAELQSEPAPPALIGPIQVAPPPPTASAAPTAEAVPAPTTGTLTAPQNGQLPIGVGTLPPRVRLGAPHHHGAAAGTQVTAPAAPAAANAQTAVPAAPTAVNAQTAVPAAPAATNDARDRDRDASVKAAMGDDLRPLLEQPHRTRTLEDPFH